MHLNLQSTAFDPNFLIDSFRKILIRFWEFFSFCTKRYGCFSIGNVISFISVNLTVFTIKNEQSC